jgi:quinol monooxygenase YgiN
MVSVIASIHIVPGQRSAFLDIFSRYIPKVRAEDGCVEYYPAVDVDASLPVQQLDENVVTIIEKWQSLDALKIHLAAPHMLEYKEQVKDLVEKVTLKVLQQA